MAAWISQDDNKSGTKADRLYSNQGPRTQEESGPQLTAGLHRLLPDRDEECEFE